MAKLTRKQKAKRRQDKRIAKQERRIDREARRLLESGPQPLDGAPAPEDTEVRAFPTVLEGGKPKERDLSIKPEVLAASKRDPRKVTAQQAFAIPKPAPGVVPDTVRAQRQLVAMDDGAEEISVWAAGTWASGWFDGPLFMGYPALSLLAALPEYRRMAEVLATECTRKWIKIAAAASNRKAKLQKVTAIETEMKRLDVRGHIRRCIELDAFFGIAHLYLDVGTPPDDRKELVRSIGDGQNETTKLKLGGCKGFLKGMKSIEAVWCYPSRYNATNPLKDDWYAPQTWFVQGQEIHVTRLLTFVGREVPDLLKPAYMFGGISLSQLMKPYVDRWISVVQAVADVVIAFSTSGIKTNLETILKPGASSSTIFDRLELFNNLRSNRGAMVLDKETEEFFQFNTPLTDLKDLASKFQEFMCSVSGEPVVKLLGIQPAGLNASSQGEITSWLDWCEAFREKFCAWALTVILNFIQLSLFGEVDPDITWTWESLRSLDPKEETERRKVQAEMDATYVELGAFSAEEIRAHQLADPESPYYGIEDITPDEPEGPVGSGLLDPSAEGLNAEMAELFPGLLQGLMGERDQSAREGRRQPGQGRAGERASSPARRDGSPEADQDGARPGRSEGERPRAQRQPRTLKVPTSKLEPVEA